VGERPAIYDFVNFIDEMPDGSKTWLQWEAAIDGRKSIYGVTALQHNDAGEIVETASTSCPSRTSRGNRLAGSPVASHVA
jgi:hypothetical protein